LPDLSPRGIDIKIDDLRVAADDFECRETSLLTGVRLWGSWNDDLPGRIESLHLSIHADDPVGLGGTDSQNTFSQPEPDALWSLDVGPGQYTAKAYSTLPAPGEYWWDPRTGELQAGADRRVWQLDIPIDPESAFLQTGTEQKPVIYWLEVRARTEWGEFGWKTRQWPEHFMDDAVWDAGSELPRTWHELRYPVGHPYHALEENSIDLAFALSSTLAFHQFVVNSTGDGSDASASVGNGICDDGSGGCTLRAAIQETNALPNLFGGPDQIYFDIPGAGPYTIRPQTALPTISDAVTIDATTEPDFAGTPVVELSGNLAGAGVSGLRFTVGGNTVQGLVINGFSSVGILVSGAAGNRIVGNWIGTDMTGTLDRGNAGAGVFVTGAGNTIEDNLISGNDQQGVVLATAAASGNVVRRNRIGTDPSGMIDLGNRFSGVLISNAPSNTVGGSDSDGNLIAGNGAQGLYVTGGTAAGNLIQGNAIGGTLTAGAAPANGDAGVQVDSANNRILNNVVTGNAGSGVTLSGAGATGNMVQGNAIGTDRDGLVRRDNGGNGIGLLFAPGNMLGGSGPGEGNLIIWNRAGGIFNQGGANNTIVGNVISGSGRQGLTLATIGASGNTVQGNRIGTDPTGTIDLGNHFAGILVSNAPNNLIGGTGAAGNLVSGNDSQGIYVVGASASGNQILGNRVGVNLNATAALGNSDSGVAIESAHNAIAGNIIGGNRGTGLLIMGAAATGNMVQGNWIGTDLTAALALGNHGNGVAISSAVGNVVGGTAATGGNVIAWNTKAGVYVLGTSAVDNAIRGNAIHGNGGLGIDLAPVGAAANDENDPDTGANQLQNYPTMTAAVLSGGTLTISYSVPSSTANSAYPLAVEFFLADAAAQEGQQFLGGESYGAPGADTASFMVSGVTIGQRIVATATDANGNTSEFSPSFVIAAPLLAPVAAAETEVAAETVAAPAVLDEAALQPLVWQAAGLDAHRVAQLQTLSFEIADLPGRYLGWATLDRIVLDADAAGFGWYTSAKQQAEEAEPRMDLLTAVMHEMGHVLGLADLADGDALMSGLLSVDTRHLPTTAAVDQILAQGDWLP